MKKYSTNRIVQICITRPQTDMQCLITQRYYRNLINSFGVTIHWNHDDCLRIDLLFICLSPSLGARIFLMTAPTLFT